MKACLCTFITVFANSVLDKKRRQKIMYMKNQKNSKTLKNPKHDVTVTQSLEVHIKIE